MGGVKHIPFSRFKSLFADLTEDDARAKGYVKGNYKIEEVFGLLRRSTGPTTVYKKQELDRDDVVDITSFDVVAWLRNEMRYKLNRELALAYILGDGRMAASRDKIDENCIRPVFNDADLFTIKVQVKTTGMTTVEDKYKAFIKQAIRARKDYRGSGTPTMFTTEDALTEMLLLEDGMGRPLYTDEAALARKLGITRASVNAWEMELSSPTAVYLVEMAQLFHTTTDDILGLTAEEQISLRGMTEQEKRLVYNLIDYISERNKP